MSATAVFPGLAVLGYGHFLTPRRRRGAAHADSADSVAA